MARTVRGELLLRSTALKALSRTSINTNHKNEVTTVQAVVKLVHRDTCVRLKRNYLSSAKKEPTRTIKASIFATIVQKDFTAEEELQMEFRVHLASLLMEQFVLLVSQAITVRLKAPL